MGSDIEIARAARLKPIAEIAAKIGAPESALRPFGRFIAKLEYDFLDSLSNRPDGKLILVTAISPTPAGEGKTTTTIGLGDALNRIGRKTIICLREPSLGPELRHEGGRNRRRPRPSCPHGRDQPPFHRRFSRHHIGAQSACGDDRQSHVLGQRAPSRSAARRLAARARYERPRASRDRCRAWRGQRLSARGRFRHYRRLGSHGGLLPCNQPRGARGAARPHGGWLGQRQAADRRLRSQRARRHDCAAQGRAQAQPRANARRLRPRWCTEARSPTSPTAAIP